MHLKFKKSEYLYNKATQFIAGGVNSNFRLNEPAIVPLFFEKAQGSYMCDVDVNQYIDSEQDLEWDIRGYTKPIAEQAHSYLSDIIKNVK